MNEYNPELKIGRVDVVRVFKEPEATPVPYHHDALAYWNERRGDKFAPAWKDVSLLDLPPDVVPLTSVTDITLEPLSSVYRFFGTELTRIHGGDYTGKSPSLVPPAALGIANTGGCGRLVNDRMPHLEIKEFRNQNGLLGNAIILRLPLSNDGMTVNHGLNIYYFEHSSANQPMHAFFSSIFRALAEDRNQSRVC